MFKKRPGGSKLRACRFTPTEAALLYSINLATSGSLPGRLVSRNELAKTLKKTAGMISNLVSNLRKETGDLYILKPERMSDVYPAAKKRGSPQMGYRLNRESFVTHKLTSTTLLELASRANKDKLGLSTYINRADFISRIVDLYTFEKETVEKVLEWAIEKEYVYSDPDRPERLHPLERIEFEKHYLHFLASEISTYKERLTKAFP